MQPLVILFESHPCYIQASHHHNKDIFVLAAANFGSNCHFSFFKYFVFQVHCSPSLCLNVCLLILVPLKTIVEAIMKIKMLYRVTRNWQGDPCVPSEYSWDGLNCSYNDSPSIISLQVCFQNIQTCVEACCEISIHISAIGGKSSSTWRHHIWYNIPLILIDMKIGFII